MEVDGSTRGMDGPIWLVVWTMQTQLGRRRLIMRARKHACGFDSRASRLFEVEEAPDVTIDEKCAAIYAAYPRKVGKIKAFAAIAKALKAVDYDILIAAVRKFALIRLQSVEHPLTTPHCTTWMNQGRWDDDPADWQAQMERENKRAGNTSTDPLEAERRRRIEKLRGPQ